MATTTTNYAFSLPTIGGDLNAWGAFLNANWTALDALLNGIETDVATALAGSSGAQPLDATLTALAGLTVAANKGLYATGADAFATYDLTAYGRTLGGLADAAALQTNLGLVIGTNVQAYDADLAAIAALVSAANKVPYFTGAGTAALLDFKDEDNMISNSATAVPSQQSTKAYVDAQIAALPAGSGWEYYNGTDGIVYSHAVTGNVVDVESAALTDGYEYLIIYDGISVNTGTTAFNIGLYRETSAAYATDVPLGSVANSTTWSGFSYIQLPRLSLKQHSVQSQFLVDANNVTTLAAMTDYAVQHTTRQKVGKFRWRFSSNNIDSGIICMLRRPVVAS